MDRLGIHLFLIDQAFAFLLEEHAPGVGNGHFTTDDVFGKNFFQHPLDIEIELVAAGTHAGNHHRLCFLLDLYLDGALFHFATHEHGPHFLARALIALRRIFGIHADVKARGGWRKHIEQSFLDAAIRLRFDIGQLLLTHESDGMLDQFADHAFHIAAIVAHLGILAGFHFDEWRAGERGQAAGNFGLADAGGANHENVLGGHLTAQFIVQLLPPPAITDGHRDGPLGRILAHDVTIELGDNLARRQVWHASSSRTIC